MAWRLEVSPGCYPSEQPLPCYLFVFEMGSLTGTWWLANFARLAGLSCLHLPNAGITSTRHPPCLASTLLHTRFTAGGIQALNETQQSSKKEHPAGARQLPPLLETASPWKEEKSTWNSLV